MNTIEALSDKKMTELQGWALHARIYDHNRFSAGSLESDGRKQKKLLRQLCEADLIRQTDDGYVMNVDAIIETIEVEPVDLRQRWNELHASDYNPWEEDFIRTTDLSNGQLKHLLESNVQFYVVSDAPFRWTSYRFRDEAGDPVEGERGEAWWGPFGHLATAMQQLDTARKNFSRGTHGSFEIVLTSPELEKHVDSTLFNERIDRLYSQNLLWGMETLGIATTNDLYYPLKEGEEKRRPRISVTLDDGIVLGYRGSSLGDKSEDWENNLAQSMERHRNQIAESQRALELLTKIDTNIQKYGGWAKFKADYREALVEAVRKQENA